MISFSLAAALRLYLIADPDQCDGDLLSCVERALEGGVTAVQMRAKTLTDREMVELGRQLHDLTHRFHCQLLVNDRIDIALAIGADGVHLGVTDLAPSDARGVVPQSFIIGYSPEDEFDTAGANADYLGIGPVFGTSSKTDAGAALGIDGFVARVKPAQVPVVGIGGIDAGNARSVVDAGASGVAVISAILRQPDPGEAARRLKASLARPG